MKAFPLPASVQAKLKTTEARCGIGVVVTQGNINPRSLAFRVAEDLATHLGDTVVVRDPNRPSPHFTISLPSIVWLNKK